MERPSPESSRLDPWTVGAIAVVAYSIGNVVHEGLGFRLETFPLGTRVVYPPESIPTVPDVDEAIRDALLHPLDSEPLPAMLWPGMRLTIAFDDLSLPLPTMRAPDVRGRIIEAVLTMAAEAGVDDVKLIAANALHRRMTAARVVGTNLVVGFWLGVAGVIGHLPGGVDWGLMLLGSADSIPGAVLGSRITEKLSERQLLNAIGVALLIAGSVTVARGLA